MATPIGHVLAGYLIYRSTRGADTTGSRDLLFLCLFLAVSPDLDFVPGVLNGQPALYHQGISHSVAFAAGAGLVAVLAYRAYGRRKANLLTHWGLFSLAYASHLSIDLFGPDKRPPYGIPLFWPVSSETYIAPVQIFRGVHHASVTSASTDQWIIGILNPCNLVSISIEVLVFLPFILFVMYVQRLCLGSGRPEREQQSGV